MTHDDRSRPEGAALLADTVTARPHWSVNPAVAYAAAAAILLAALALIAGRPELALIALPLLLGVAAGAGPRPARGAAVRVSNRLRPDDDASGVGYRLSVDAPEAVEAVSIVLVTAEATTHRFTVDPRTARDLNGRIPVAHSGPQQIARLQLSLLARGGAVFSSPEPGPESSRLIPPPQLKIETLPFPHRVFGIIGAHPSVSPGDGGEFRDVARFAPGDRLRRIDWKATARRSQQPGELYVRRSFATADAIVMIVLDDRDELGANVRDWAGSHGSSASATSLDLGREATTSLAAAYLAAGDRVGFRDLAGTTRAVEPGGGDRHLERLRATIAKAVPSGEPTRVVRAPVLPAGALVIVVSTFLDEEAATMATTWVSTGHRVIAVDALPQPESSALTREETTAFRLMMIERRDRIDAMGSAGVEAIRWQPSETALPPALQLRLLSRPRRLR